MTDLREAAQQALEALDWYAECAMVSDKAADAASALRAALEQPEQEPCDIAKDGVCEALECCKQTAQEQFCDGHCTWRDHHPACVRAERQQRTLTDEVIANLWHQNGGFHHHFARNIERWIKGQA
jgi:hypothetical protein